MFVRNVSLVAFLLLPCAAGAVTCDQVIQALGAQISGPICSHSSDLTTANPATTPQDNSITTFADGVTTLPGGGFTPFTDRGVISPAQAANRTPITKAVPGVQLDAWLTDDPAGQARLLIRLPDTWNGNLVVAGASGTRSEFNGDFAWSDYVIQKGYAYASQNKGVLNLSVVSASSTTPPISDPTPCRLNPLLGFWVHFYDNDPLKPFTQWTQYMIEAAQLARVAVKGAYNHYPTRTYAVGTSNGGYQVRRAVEEAPDLFDGGVDWEGTFVNPDGPNILIDLPPAIENWPGYLSSGFNPSSPEAENIIGAGYPPDIVNAPSLLGSLWGNYWNQFWEVTQCQWQKRFDPDWQTYNDGLGDITGTGGYDYLARIALDPSIAAGVATVATSGKIKKPLITVAGTLDALLPIKRGARAYEALVNASRKGNNNQRASQYRLYEIQNGNHIESYKDRAAFAFPQLEFIEPHAQKAFDLLVAHVEQNAPLPPSQCVARGGAIGAPSSTPGHCANLFVGP
jgi:pimeloyl-ACP methyl ester carboxylesterase